MALSNKLIIAVGLVTLAILGVFSYVIQDTHRNDLTGEVTRGANQLSDTVKSSTRYAMLNDQREALHKTIDAIGQEDGIQRVRVFNKEGSVMYSSSRDEIGEMVDKKGEACYVCHAAGQPIEKLATTERTRIFRSPSGTGGRTLGVINPIYNEPSCWTASCHVHSQSQKVLGVLDITMSLDPVDDQMQAGQLRMVSLSLLAIALIAASIWLLVRRLVLQPVNRLRVATKRVAGGDLEYTIDPVGKDELGALAHSFNEMTRKLAETQKQLYQSDKLASLGRLGAGVAHELNNPLTAVLSYSSFLQKRMGAEKEVQEDLGVIVRETIRCREIVKELLDFARQSTPAKREIDLNDVIKRAESVVANQYALRDIRLEKQLEENLPKINADINQLQQVFVNLLVNASDAVSESEEEGKGTGNAKAEKKGPIVVSSHLVAPNGNGSRGYVEAKVSDSARGIPSEHLSKIFEPFFTTKGTKGTGLGLSVVWGIINSHGATIDVESEQGKGTTFSIRFPIEESGLVKVTA